MNSIMNKQNWEEYSQKTLQEISPLLAELGFVLDNNQVHLSGERYLMSGHKLVLTGRKKDSDKRIIIKSSNHPDGIREITEERQDRLTLNNINFAYRTFFSPAEILFTRARGYAISAVVYIEQKKPFFSHTLKEQFFLSLRALVTQEGVHATASAHTKIIRKTFSSWNADKYLGSFKKFKESAKANAPDNIKLGQTLDKALQFLTENKKIIDYYSDFLTHGDFVPHNLRIVDKDIYLLDYASIHFGNKYESWARLINYMIIYNQPLAEALTSYVRANRGAKEYLSLRLLRVYKLGFLLHYYIDSLTKTTGDLHQLSQERINFWMHVLKSVLEDKELPEQVVQEYKNKRDQLRSQEEKERQKELQQL